MNSIESQNTSHYAQTGQSLGPGSELPSLELRDVVLIWFGLWLREALQRLGGIMRNWYFLAFRTC